MRIAHGRGRGGGVVGAGRGLAGWWKRATRNLEVLKRDPGHRLALNQLGGLPFGAGHRTAARTAYAEAVARHPDDPTGARSWRGPKSRT